MVEERISNVFLFLMKINQQKLPKLSNREKMLKKNEQSLRDWWGNIKYTNIHGIVVSEGEEIW